MTCKNKTLHHDKGGVGLVYNWTGHNWKVDITSLHEVFGLSILRRNIYFGRKTVTFCLRLSQFRYWCLCTTCNETYSKDTIRDECSTALFSAYTVDNFYAVDNVDSVYTIDMVYTVDIVYTVDMVDNVDIVLHC